MNKRRIFVAINISENLKEKLINYQAKWPDLDPKQIRWTGKSNLHITLIFVGYVTDDEMYNICAQVREVAKRHESFFINFEKIILGPPHDTPRMFWVEGEKSQELADLQTDLRDVIEQRNGVKYKAFGPHITLARFRYQLLKSLPEKIDEPFKAQVAVDSIEVMQSNLKRTGSDYTVLESVELGL